MTLQPADPETGVDGLAGQQLVRLAFRSPSKILTTSVSRSAARQFAQRGRRGGLLSLGELAPPGMMARLPRHPEARGR